MFDGMSSCSLERFAYAESGDTGLSFNAGKEKRSSFGRRDSQNDVSPALVRDAEIFAAPLTPMDVTDV